MSDKDWVVYLLLLAGVVAFFVLSQLIVDLCERVARARIAKRRLIQVQNLTRENALSEAWVILYAEEKEKADHYKRLCENRADYDVIKKKLKSVEHELEFERRKVQNMLSVEVQRQKIQDRAKQEE